MQEEIIRSIGAPKEPTLSLLELCKNEEWNIIIESAQDMIHVWDFEEKDSEGNNYLLEKDL